ncbi:MULTISPECIES: folate/biopterin family MFS transporter [Cyanophyceae]|uniref:folate/biopterin family MFS transporter n=1 Tax=Cyanophyceae TaxID=3028117 RepID=UPI00016DCDBC|nr:MULTISPECIES: folate/biopterin family MFS transporter [unclassified Picosynechococcus]ACB00534.1 integral membrane protein [Picosynechococcus sp. PCC 7002]SMH50099.1 folate/biopterin transporter [Picosynechococcus sp. OG1]SMQ81754.1 folate/biopterin transporter [Synechococcus sp. 7002]
MTFLDNLKKPTLFGHAVTPELFALLTVYFVQGILNLSRLAVSFFLKDDLGLTPAEVAALTGLAAFPWVVKPLFGFLSDGFPIFGYRRRSYLILAGLLGCGAWAAMATIVQAPWLAATMIVLSSISVAISDVIVDSVVVERARAESLDKVGSLQSLTWAVAAVGSLTTAYLSGWLLEQFSTRVVFGITAIFPLLVSAIALLIIEQPREAISLKATTDNIGNQMKTLWGAVRQKKILLPTAFVFLWQATPSADSAFFFFVTNELDFNPEFLGRVRLVTSFAALAGIAIYQKYLKQVSFRKMLGWSTVISAVLGFTTLILVTHANRALGIDDRWFSLGDNLILTVTGEIALMPILVLSARLCPPGVEATMFALLMSSWNLAGLLSHELGALLTQWLGVTETNFDRLWLLVTITNLTTLLPLVFLKWLPAGDPQADLEEHTTPSVELYEHHAAISGTESALFPTVEPNLVGSQSEKQS